MLGQRLITVAKLAAVTACAALLAPGPAAAASKGSVDDWLGTWHTSYGTIVFDSAHPHFSYYYAADTWRPVCCELEGIWDQKPGLGKVPFIGYVNSKDWGYMYTGQWRDPSYIAYGGQPDKLYQIAPGAPMLPSWQQLGPFLRLIRTGDRIVHGFWKDCGLTESCEDHHAWTGHKTSARFPLELSYQMARRFVYGADGLVHFPETRHDADPTSWKVTFQASPCEAGEYEWEVDGTQHRTDGCILKTTVSRLGRTEVTARAGPAAGRATFELRDHLVLGIGDSLASGEGAPDQPRGFRDNPDAVWTNQQCHRSGRSHQALDALSLQQDDPSNAVTFVHLGCSGADLDSGLFAPYEGIEPLLGPPLPAQLPEAKHLIGDRVPDVVLVNIGVNHAHFGAVLGYCTVLFSSVRHNCRNYHVTFDRGSGSFKDGSSGDPTLSDYVAQKLAELPERYRGLNNALRRMGVPPSHVYIDLYPDPTRTTDGMTFCPDFLSVGVGGIDVDDTRWLALSYALPLNVAISTAARRYHWILVTAHTGPFYAHGYCGGVGAWINTLGDSFRTQGNKEGAMHPNYEGQQQISAAEYALIKRNVLHR